MKVSSLLELALFFIRNGVVTVFLSMGKMMYGEVGTYGSRAGLDTKVIECLCVRIKVLEAIQSGFCHWRAEDRTVMRRRELGMMETGWDGRDEDEETKERFSEPKRDKGDKAQSQNITFRAVQVYRWLQASHSHEHSAAMCCVVCGAGR